MGLSLMISITIASHTLCPEAPHLPFPFTLINALHKFASLQLLPAVPLLSVHPAVVISGSAFLSSHSAVISAALFLQTQGHWVLVFQMTVLCVSTACRLQALSSGTVM